MKNFRTYILIGIIVIMALLLIMSTGCTRSIKADAIDDANVATSQAMARTYSQKIEVCSFEAVDGQAIEIKAKKFSCNVEARPLAYIQKQQVQTITERHPNNKGAPNKTRHIVALPGSGTAVLAMNWRSALIMARMVCPMVCAGASPRRRARSSSRSQRT